MQNLLDDYNMVFVLGYDILQDFLTNIVYAECDNAFMFCQYMYNLFPNSYYYTVSCSEYECLRNFINSYSDYELEQIYNKIIT